MDGTDVPEQDRPMTDQDQPVVDKVKKATSEAREKLAPVAEQAQATVTELKQNWTQDDQQKFNNVLQLITAVAVVGILINNRRSLKFAKKVIKNQDANVIGAQQAIQALKEAGQKFTFYPGVGVYVD